MKNMSIALKVFGERKSSNSILIISSSRSGNTISMLFFITSYIGSTATYIFRCIMRSISTLLRQSLYHSHSAISFSAIIFVGFTRTRIAPSVLFLSPYAFALFLPIYSSAILVFHFNSSLYF